MGKRLTQITTRTGDDGTTGLSDNTRVPKHSPRIQAMGDVDELNAQLGLLLCEPLPTEVAGLLTEVQHQLFNVGGELAAPGLDLVKEGALATLDQALTRHNSRLPALQEFILPGGSRAASQAHVCRTVARRAERSVAALAATEALSPVLLRYLNRLSDLLFVLARVLNQAQGVADVYWNSHRLAAGDPKDA